MESPAFALLWRIAWTLKMPVSKVLELPEWEIADWGLVFETWLFIRFLSGYRGKFLIKNRFGGAFRSQRKSASCRIRSLRKNNNHANLRT